MRPISSYSDRQLIIILIGLNFLLKFAFLFIDTSPSDVQFYRATGWLLLYDNLPYLSFDPNNEYAVEILWNTTHPNGPLNYLFYWGILIIFGDSVFAIKFPWIIAEVLIAMYIFKLGVLYSKREYAFLMALLYSITIPSYYPAIVHGCDEIITSAFALMGLYYFLQERPILSGLFLTLGIAYKMYPIFFFLPLFLFCLKNGKLQMFWTLILMSILTYTIIIFPYLILCPEDFLAYTLGQSNRFITISYGTYIEDTWFYQPLFPSDFLFLQITPHFLFEIGIMGGYFVWDYNNMKKGSYSVQNVFQSLCYYVIMLPIVSFSYNYRYFQWILPIFLIYLLLKNRTVIMTQEDNIIESIMLQNKKIIKYLLVFNIICEILIVFIYFYQISNENYFFIPLGILVKNNYLLSFFLLYTLYLIFTLVLSKNSYHITHWAILSYINGLIGILFYLSYEGRQNNEAYELPLLIFSLILLALSVYYYYYTSIKKKMFQN